MVNSMEKWVRKIAVVTGASCGIGEKIAEKLVEQGLVVIGMARRAELIEEKIEKLQGLPGELHAMKVDITNDEELIKAFEEIEEKFGAVHVLVNNAGIIPTSTLIDGNITVWRKILDTNFLALCVATREAIRSMRKHSIDGHIVHINSVTGHNVPLFPWLSVYPASKFAVTAVTESLRVELLKAGSKIKVSSISPGFVRTPAVIGVDMPEDAAILEAEDIADGVIYVLSTPPHVQIHELMIRPVGEDF
ncbi:hypothetical protein HHI36_002192 [Cryptolaemus montrouzieri]|uniref:Uncharacterized protein n=1 Tax=Cryptolaemus montrouzieri TaxID=559131 RepID=A0ABD2P9X1_9CUCU